MRDDQHAVGHPFCDPFVVAFLPILLLILVSLIVFAAESGFSLLLVLFALGAIPGGLVVFAIAAMLRDLRVRRGPQRSLRAIAALSLLFGWSATLALAPLGASVFTLLLPPVGEDSSFSVIDFGLGVSIAAPPILFTFVLSVVFHRIVDARLRAELSAGSDGPSHSSCFTRDVDHDDES
jgi:hypothetical protein